MTNKVAVVTGGSGGIGRCTAAALRDAGCTVYELSRREVQADGIIHITADVTDEAQVRAAVKQITDKEGRIDILVNNAGFGISGAAELTESWDSHAQLELNLFGMDNVTRSVLPVMRAQGGGRIVCMSSIAGIVPIPFQLWYSVSKSAVISYVLALQNEVRPFNISICAIMPGDIASGFTDARRKSAAGDDVYAGRIARSVAVMEHDERTGMTAEYAGKFVAKYALKKNSRPLVAMGTAYKGAALIAKLLPRRLSNWIVGKIYAK
jgi:NAD(P)-dependent dehydrogenase (short-subunit alcohol dehydrogenase family)